MNSKAWVLAAALLSTGMAQATCYSVYRADGTLIQEGPTTPVNLALPLGDSVPEKFGSGASMTMSDLGVYCRNRRGPAAAAKAGAKAAANKRGEPSATQPATAGEVETTAAR